MTLKSLDALEALEAVLEAAAGLPACRRNDVTLQGFETSGMEGVAWKLALADDDIATDAEELGDPPQFELAVACEIIFAVEGAPGGPRDQVFKGGFEALATALFPAGLPLVIADKFDNLIVERVERHHIINDNAKPVEAVKVALALIVSNAPSPLG